MSARSYLGPRGYTIYKSELSVEEQFKIREELTVKPYVPKTIMINLESFPIYKESQNKFYIPKYYGIEKYGKQEETKISDGATIDIKFNGSLREYQNPIVKKFLDSIDNENGCGGGLIDLPCGQGKCHKKNTKILMYNGEIKLVQDINIGEQLMGDDSKPRNVVSLARGKEMMYDVVQEKGIKYTVNESHILSLKCVKDYKHFKKDEIYDLSLLTYIRLYNESKEIEESLQGYSVAVEFEYKKQEIEPYEYGYSYISKLSEIKKDYKINTKENRRKFLAGIIDRIGIKIINGYVIKLENENTRVLNDIIFIAKSLGLATYNIALMNNNITRNKCYYKLYIYGYGIQNLPIKKDENKLLEYNENENVLVKKIKIVKKEIDNYYGFMLDGNHRYLLEDFTVTHNTVLALNIISEVKKKTLIVVHKTFLLNQWVERIKEFLPTANIGLIQGQIIDIDNKDIVIGMLQSLSMKEYPQELFSSFGFTIVDECHHISSEVFSRSLQTIITKVTLGLSATMNRKDGLTKVFKMFLGDIIYKGERTQEDNVLVKGIEYRIDDEDFNEVIVDYRGNPAYSTMISKLCNYNHRSEFIIRVLINELKLNPNQQIMILGQYKNILVYLFKAIEHRNIGSVGYYVGGMKEKDLKETESKQIVIATYAMAAEGLDIKSLTTLIMVTPKTDITQSVGRILRVKHEKPLIIDIIDSHSLFQKQWIKRKNFYEKNNYKIIHTNNNLYELDKWEDLTKKKKQRNKKSKNISDEENEVNNIGKCLIDIKI